MASELADSVGAELARLYAEWVSINETAAALLSASPQGRELKGYRVAEFARAEAMATALALRYRTLSAQAGRPALTP